MPKEINLHITVEELLAVFPSAVPVFLRHHMACVGCSMASFETLTDAARIYHVDQDLFLQELKDVFDPNDAGQTG